MNELISKFEIREDVSELGKAMITFALRDHSFYIVGEKSYDSGTRVICDAEVTFDKSKIDTSGVIKLLNNEVKPLADSEENFFSECRSESSYQRAEQKQRRLNELRDLSRVITHLRDNNMPLKKFKRELLLNKLTSELERNKNWFECDDLYDLEKVISRFKTTGNNLKGSFDIEVTNLGRVYHKKRIVKPIYYKNNMFGVAFPRIGWQTRKGGISYHPRFEFVSPTNKINNNLESLVFYSIKDKDLFSHYQEKWSLLENKNSH